MFIVPIAMVVFAIAATMGSGTVRVGIADEDATPLTAQLIHQLKTNCEVVMLPRDQIKSNLTDMRIDCGIWLEKGLTNRIIHRAEGEVKIYSIQETNVSLVAQMQINNDLNAAKNIAKTAQGDESTFYEGMKNYWEGNLTVEKKEIENPDGKKKTSGISLGFLVMNMLFLATLAPSLMLEDKENKTFYRVFTSPLTLRKYMMYSIISFYMVSLLQVAAIFLFMKFSFNADFGPSFLSMLVVFLVFGLVCVAFGVAVNALAKDRRQSGLISSLLVTPMAMLGGCMWPRSMMPEMLLNIGNFVPTTWVMKAVEKLLYGNTLASAVPELLVLGLFGLVFFLLGSWKKTDIAL